MAGCSAELNRECCVSAETALEKDVCRENHQGCGSGKDEQLGQVRQDIVRFVHQAPRPRRTPDRHEDISDDSHNELN